MTSPLDRMAAQPLTHRLTPRPKPQTFRIAEPIDVDEMRWMTRHGMTQQEVLRRLKRSMVARLAEHLDEHCTFFEFDWARLMRERTVCIEITIDDRGTYEGMVDGAERAGYREGFKRAIEAAPYGMDEVYE